MNEIEYYKNVFKKLCIEGETFCLKNDCCAFIEPYDISFGHIAFKITLTHNKDPKNKTIYRLVQTGTINRTSTWLFEHLYDKLPYVRRINKNIQENKND